MTGVCGTGWNAAYYKNVFVWRQRVGVASGARTPIIGSVTPLSWRQIPPFSLGAKERELCARARTRAEGELSATARRSTRARALT
jgi:hypothetical protein